MCLAIYKPAGVVLDNEDFRNGFRSNSDGAGFAVARKGEIIVQKGFFVFEEFLSAYEPFKEEQCLIHFRIGTAGGKTVENCHPFGVSEETALIHNGILSIQRNLDLAMSDTWHWNEHLLKEMAIRDRGFFLRPEIQFLGEAAMGSGNKFCFLRGDGEYSIWNEDSGHWAGKAWWSNNSYKPWSYSSVSDSKIGYYTKSLSTRELWSDTEAGKKALAERKWWQGTEWRGNEEDEEITLTDSPAGEEDADLDEESVFYSTLSYRQRVAYEEMVDEGISIEEIDEMITLEGPDSLLQYTGN